MQVISSLWGERVVVDEVEVHISANGHRRAAIARRPDGFFCIYRHCKLPLAFLRQFKWEYGEDYADNWRADNAPAELLYEDREPERGIYGTLDDARREVRSTLESSEPESP